MKKALACCKDTIHFVELFFIISKNGKKGMLVIQAEINSVNESSIIFFQKIKHKFFENKLCTVSTLASIQSRNYVTPTSYLYKVLIHENVNSSVSPYDDGDEF